MNQPPTATSLPGRPEMPPIVREAWTFTHAYLVSPDYFPYTEHYAAKAFGPRTVATVSLDLHTGMWIPYLNPDPEFDRSGIHMPDDRYDTAETALDALVAVMRDRDYPDDPQAR